MITKLKAMITKRNKFKYGQFFLQHKTNHELLSLINVRFFNIHIFLVHSSILSLCSLFILRFHLFFVTFKISRAFYLHFIGSTGRLLFFSFLYIIQKTKFIIF